MARFLVALLFAPLLHAATYLVPSDGEMVQGSDAIVVATGVTSFSERDARGGIVTRFILRVEESLKGELTPGQHLVLTEPGGVVGRRAKIIAGAPRYEPGVRYVIFTATNRDHEPATYGLGLGQFELRGELAFRRSIHGFTQNFEPHAEQPRRVQELLGAIRLMTDPSSALRAPSPLVEGRRVSTHTSRERPSPLVRGEGAPRVDEGFSSPIFPEHANESPGMTDSVRTDALKYQRNSYLLEDGAVGYRWEIPTVSWVRAGTQPGSDGALAVTRAFAQWNGTESNIDYLDRGVDETATTGMTPDDGKNTILFNDPNNEVVGPIGVGGASAEETYDFDGETFWSITEGDVVIDDRSFTQSCLDTLVAHEVGHTLGIRHSNEPPAAFVCETTAECTSAAVMNASITCAYNGVLRDWDRNAAETVYGDGPSCTPVSITIHPQSREIRRGAVVTLTVAATGTAPLHYEWYEGPRGDTSKPVGHDSPRLNVTTPLYFSTEYWVRVSNDCGSEDSGVSVVTVPPAPKRRGVRH